MKRMFENSIRGGMSFCNVHIATASNPYVGNNMEHKMSLMYVDENNLYGNALCMKLPVSDFVQCSEIPLIDWRNVDTEGDIGYLLEVDLDYPMSIHNATESFPLAPENMEITNEMLTPLMKRQLSAMHMARHERDVPMLPTRKLVASCRDKKNYVVHFKVLKFYLRKGMIISKIHTVISFQQYAIYKNYIDFNTDCRSKATNDFTKTFYKQINCSLFGKSMEDVRNRLKIHLVGDPQEYRRLAGKPNFIGTIILDQDLVMLQMTNDNVKLKSTIAIGAAVLDLSKLVMYELVMISCQCMSEH